MTSRSLATQGGLKTLSPLHTITGMEIIFELLLELMSYAIGAPALRCLSGGRIKVVKEETSAWGFSRSADGSISIASEWAGLFGLVLLALAIGLAVCFGFHGLKP